MVYIRQPMTSFNVILEGGEWDFSSGNDKPSYDAKYRFVNVPNFDGLEHIADKGTLVVSDGLEIFTMAGRRRLSSLPKKYIILSGALKFWPESAPPGQEENSLLESIRAVFTREGLVFLNKNMTNYDSYIGWALDFVERDVAGMFNCPYCEATYRALFLGDKNYTAGYGEREKFDKAVKILKERSRGHFD